MINEETKNEAIIKTKANIFFIEKTFVHLKKYNGEWFNGLLFDVSENYLTIHDREDGQKKVFFIEIKSMDEFTERSE